MSINFKMLSPDKPLFVNLNPNQHYYAERSEEDGIRQLLFLAENSPHEETWIVIKGSDEKGRIRALWYEVGENETVKSAYPKPAVVQSAFSHAKSIGLTFTHYIKVHIHSQLVDTTVEVFAREFLPEPETPKFPKMVFPLSAYVSIKDFNHFCEMPTQNMPFEEHVALGRRIVTPYGLWSFNWDGVWPLQSRSVPEVDRAMRASSKCGSNTISILSRSYTDFRQCRDHGECTPTFGKVKPIRKVLWDADFIPTSALTMVQP